MPIYYINGALSILNCMQETKKYSPLRYSKPVVATGNLVLRIDTSVTPVTVDKIFGLVGRDHSVYKVYNLPVSKL